MKTVIRLLSIFSFSMLFLFIPIVSYFPVTANNTKPTADQFEDAEEALVYEKYNDVISGGSVYDSPTYEEIGAVLAINYMVEYLDGIYTTVSAETTVDSSTKGTILNEITAYKEGLQSRKTSIETRVHTDAQEELTRVKSVISEVDVYCDEIFVRVHYWNGQIMQSRITTVYTQLSSVLATLEIKIAASSQDVSAAQVALSKAKTKQQELATQKDLSAKKFASITEKGTASLYLSQGKQYVREAQIVAQDFQDSLNTVIFNLQN